MDYQKLDKKIKLSWRIARFIRLVIIMSVLGVPRLVLGGQANLESFIFYFDIFLLAVFLYLIITFIVYPMVEYRQWSYALTNDRVEIHHGIFFVRTTVIPIIRIQHVTISQGPVNRILKLSTVIIYTASGSFVIEGLSNDTARLIGETLKSKLYTRIEENDRTEKGESI